MSENEKMESIIKSIFESMNDEQRAKAKNFRTVDELIDFLGDEGIELPDELLDGVGGGLDSALTGPGRTGLNLMGTCRTITTRGANGGTDNFSSMGANGGTENFSTMGANGGTDNFSSMGANGGNGNFNAAGANGGNGNFNAAGANGGNGSTSNM